MPTSSNTLWSVLMGNIPLSQWVSINELYQIIEQNFNGFLADDLLPVTATNPEQTWHRNLRNVLQSKRVTGELIYDGNASYQIERPYIWRMIKDAVNHFNGEISYRQIKDYIADHWNDVNTSTITAQITVLTVNHNSRIHYPENFHPRLTNTNSAYDFLFRTDRGRVEKYVPEVHGVWEIYLTPQDEPNIRQHVLPEAKVIYTPSDIVWIKNVTNTIVGEAYFEFQENVFTLHFPTIHQTNASTPKVNELILLFQRVNGIHAFTHIVTPVDAQVIIDPTRPGYRYGRKVKVIAHTDVDNIIPISTTLWEQVNFAGISQGNVCNVENINNIGDVDELRIDVWQHFFDFFTPSEKNSAEVIAALLSEVMESNPEITATEGRVKLISHLAKERNRAIVVRKKQDALEAGRLLCEVCSFSFIERFNKEFIECHHIMPIGEHGVRETRLEDLVLVCPNCHRMLHTKFDGEYLTYQQLREQIGM